MPDLEHEPQEPATPTPQQPGVPPVGPGFPTSPPVPPTQPQWATPVPEKRSRAWVWWTVGVFVFLVLLIGSCALPMMFMRDGTSGASFGDAIAVIRLDRAIAGTGGSASIVTPEDFNYQLKQALDDPMVKAIVLRIDSPGGTVAASEEISRYVELADKPVYASIGDIGASGAYMVASQADEIWAMPGSAVGSIGVIAQIPNVSGLLDKVGVEFQVITAGKYKDAGSPYRPLTKEEEGLIQGEIDEAYEQFIAIVAKGRDMPVSEVETLATGWVWSGTRSKELGLIDKVGTFEEAKDAAAAAGGITGDYRVVTYEDEFASALNQLLGLTSRLGGLGAVESLTEADRLRQSVPR